MATLDQYRHMLPINKLRLDDELEIQAQVQEQIGSQVALLTARTFEMKDILARIEGELIDTFKDRDSKATVDQCKARMMREPKRVRAWEDLQRVRLEHDQWDSLLQAWITKGYKLADIGGLYASDYFAVRTIGRPDGERRRELNAADEESRSAMRRASERRNDNTDDEQPRRRRAL